jgi:hypothetical protein
MAQLSGPPGLLPGSKKSNNLKTWTWRNHINTNIQSTIFNNYDKSTLSKIDTPSMFGSIYSFGPKRYVIKQMDITSERNKNIFFNEISIGVLPGIEKVGPRIHAWRTFKENGRTRGEYIMDNLALGDDVTIKPLIKYGCLRKGSQLHEMVIRTVIKFWKITGGIHGDLHGNNICAIVKSGTVKRVMIYDYGSHKKTNSKIDCIETFLKFIQGMFNVKGTEVSNNVKRIFTKNRQSIRSNENMLRYAGITRQNILNISKRMNNENRERMENNKRQEKLQGPPKYVVP